MSYSKKSGAERRPTTKVWFTGDTHFGHSKIIEYCKRPFENVREMDGALVASWNAIVGPDDDVWHLGDFAYRGTKSPGDYLNRLTGRKHLIAGNHDSEESATDPGWASVQQMAEVVVESTRLVLCHYGLRVWPRHHHGSLHLYGHSHGALPGDRQSCDVGVDVSGYRPVSLTEIRRNLKALPERGLR